MLGHLYGMHTTHDNDGLGFLSDGVPFDMLYRYNKANAKAMVWTTIALNTADQLRSRIAWALSQIYVIGAEGLGYALGCHLTIDPTMSQLSQWQLGSC